MAKIFCGSTHTLLLVNNQAYAIGLNDCGQLGLGDRINRSTLQLIEFFEDKNVQQLVCGYYSSFAIADNFVYAWGRNDCGQLGLGNNINQSIPQLVENLVGKNIQQLVSGYRHSLAIANSQVYAWGHNGYHQLGLGNLIDRSVPRLIKFFANKNIQQLVCGGSFSFAVADGRVYAWGSNNSGQLGLGHKINQSTPQLVEFFDDKNVQHITCGNYCSLAIADNQVYAWGYNEYNRLGTCGENLTPKLVEFFIDKNIKQLVCAGNSFFAIITANNNNNSVYAWGSNYYGQLGIEDIKVHPPIPLIAGFFSGKNVQWLACGYGSSFAFSNSRIYGWGRNDEGQLGLERTGNNQWIPQIVEFSQKIAEMDPSNDMINSYAVFPKTTDTTNITRAEKIIKDLISSITRTNSDTIYEEILD